MRQPRPARRWLGNALLLMLAVIAGLAAVEAAARFSYPRNYPAPGLYVADTEVGYRMVANYSGAYVKGGRTFHVVTNAQGFRDPRDFARPDVAARRVLLIGDSFAFGMPVEVDQTFAARSEREMERLCTESSWQVLNAGVPGYGTRQQAIVLRRLLAMIEPDAIVLSVYVGNDINDNLHPADRPDRRAYRGALVSPEVVECARSAWCDVWYTMRLHARGMVLGELASHAWMRVRGDFPADPYQALTASQLPSELETAWENTVRAMNTIVDASRARGIPLFALVLTSRREIERPRDRSLARPRERLLEWLSAHGVPAVDPTTALIEASGETALYETHGTHLIEPGHELVGRMLGRTLGRKLCGGSC